jgi:hypothetical protein
MWLAYALIRLLTENEAVVYYTDKNTFFFFENSVYSPIPGEIPVIPSIDKSIICIIDPDKMTTEADISFMTNPEATFPVMASSPNPSHYKIFEKERQVVTTQYMPLWTRDELKNG